MKQARVLLEVQAGLIPGQPMDEYTRQWAITSEEWQSASEKPEEQSILLAEANGKALGYANLLMLQPDRLNWVKTEWIWL